jgi:hypothetical protein
VTEWWQYLIALGVVVVLAPLNAALLRWTMKGDKK